MPKKKGGVGRVDHSLCGWGGDGRGRGRRRREGAHALWQMKQLLNSCESSCHLRCATVCGGGLLCSGVGVVEGQSCMQELARVAAEK